MVNISKQQLHTSELNKLFTQFNETIGNLQAKQSEVFLSCFLGSEEKVMFAKRLATIIMLFHGQSLYRVSEKLKISPTTAKNYKMAMLAGQYDKLFSVIKKDKTNYVQLIETIDSILHLGGALPHYGQTIASEVYKRRRN